MQFNKFYERQLIGYPLGISFQTDEGVIETLESILDTKTSVGITINGQPVREVLGPKGLPGVGTYYEIFPDHLGNIIRLLRKYGSVVKTDNMGKINYHTDDPVIAGYLFSESIYFTKKITSDHPLFGIKDNTAIFIGDTETQAWQLNHKFLPPCLSPKAIRHYTPLMQNTVRGSFKVFDEMDAANETWNVYQYMLKLASQTIGKFCLGLDFGHFNTPDSPVDPIIHDIAAMLVLNKKVTARGEWYGALPFGDPKRLKDMQRRTYERLQGAMDTVDSRDRPDLPLADAALQATCIVDYLNRGVDETGRKLPSNLILPNMVIMTAAGFTTTSSLLSWMIYSIINYRGEQARLLQELVDSGINNETEWTPEHVASLKYLEKFVKETQRLHNPSFQPARTTKTEVILPGGWRLPADAILVPALYAIHTNPAVWENPLRFDADRWDTEAVKKRHRCAYVPFATGPRGCIGFNFALQEVKILFAELLYRYEFSSESHGSVDYDADFQLIRPMNLYVRARKRTAWPAKSV
jgi:cytochrome P450